MHGTRIKITEAQQAKICNNYKNARLKLLKTNAAIWFNKICKTKSYCITNSCISNTCVTWRGTAYDLSEDDTIVSKHVKM